MGNRSPYISNHAIERYMERFNGTSRGHALNQIKAMWEFAEYDGQDYTGARKYRIADLCLVVNNGTVVTLY